MSGGSHLVVRTRRVEGAPVVAIRVWLRGGSRSESIPGQALVAGRLLTEGTRGRDWARLAADFEDRGLAVSSGAGYEVQSLAIDGLASDWRLGLEWAAELVCDSVFSTERCRWVTEQTRAELESLADHPEVVADWAFRRQLYGDHPRGRPLQGTAEALEGLDGKDCEDLHRTAVEHGVVVSVAGAIDPTEVRAAAAELFGGRESEPIPDPAPPAFPRPEARRELSLAGGEQAHLFLGALTVRRGDPLLAPLELLSVALGAGGGLVGRVPHRVRELEGLAYTCRVATAAGAGLDPGRFEIYLATAADQAGRAERVLREELRRLVEEPLSTAEIEESRSFLLGCEPFRRETARQWAGLMAEAELYGVPVDRPQWVRERIAAVTAEEIEKARALFVDPERLALTLVTPA